MTMNSYRNPDRHPGITVPAKRSGLKHGSSTYRRHSGTTLLALCILLCAGSVQAVFPPPNTNNAALGYWPFSDTNWLSQARYAPISFTNLVNAANLGDGNCLLIDSTNAAWLRYKIIENDGTTNLTVKSGTLSLWFAPAWAGTNESGGTGPGDWGRLIEVGDYTTNASYGWWSLYVDPQGVNIHFSAQGNDGSETDLSAPIDWQTNQWHNIAVTYAPTNGSATNLALYLDGALATNGPGLASWPSPDVLTNGFFVGSANDGMTQAHGMLDDLRTYNYPRDAATIRILYGVFGINYYGNPARANIFSAPSEPSLAPTFNAVTGRGYLIQLTNSVACVTNVNVWITNAVATMASNGTNMNLTFTIIGGQNGVLYDVFANSVLDFSTNRALAWAWMGQGQHCVTYMLTNLPIAGAFFILGTPQDTDVDGLTDAYERLVSKTNPFLWDTDGDGKGDGWEVLIGTDSLSYDFPSPLELPAVGSSHLRILAPDLLEMVRVSADTNVWNFVTNGILTAPSTNQFQVKSGGTSINVTQAGFKRRPLYAPIEQYDLRIENTVYLRLASTNWATSNATVEVTTTNTALWPATMRFVSVNNPLRYGPTIHVNQAGYSPTFQKKAMIGYYLGSLGEMQISTNLGFMLVNASSGSQVYPASGLATLTARPDDFASWGTAGSTPIPQYQMVLEADFTSFTTAGQYQLVVPGLGASYPFRIDEGTMMDLARTYALGLYHQRCGSGTNGLQVNDAQFTRFSHPNCHTTNASVPLPVASYQSAWDIISNTYGNVTYTANVDNPPQLAAAVTNYSAVLFGYSNNPALGIDVSGGHHDAGDYSKYTLNSAMLVHLLTFAADNLGLTNFDNFGVPESSNGTPDILDEAKWEADFLAKMQDTDGGFYFLVYPKTGEYDGGGHVLPQNGDPQIVWPKSTSATAAAVGALAEIGSSPAFRRYFGTNVAGNYLTKAQLGWAFLTNAINRYGKDGCYQRFTHYGDDFTHDDELAWAASSLFAATGNTNYLAKLFKWYPNPADTNAHNGYSFKRYNSTNNFPASSNLFVAVAYLPNTNNVLNTTNKMWFTIFDSEGQKVVTNRSESAIPHITDIPLITNKLYVLKTNLNANPNTLGQIGALDMVAQLVGNCHVTWQFGWKRCFFGYGCAVRDYAFAARSGRLNTTNLNPAYLAQCETEITNRALDLRTWSTNNAYGTSLDPNTKNPYSPEFYFAGDRTFDLAVADRISPGPANTNAIIENLNYEAGRNPINVSRITGLGSYRQREIVDQFSENNPLAVLPKSGVPLGNISDTFYYTDLYGPMDPLCFPTVARGSNFFALYDRWAEVHNVTTEFVHPQTAQAFISAGYLVTSASLRTQMWQRASASIVFPNGFPAFSTKCVAQLSTTQDLSNAQIVWDSGSAPWNFLGQDPTFGTNFTFIPATVGDNHNLQAEAVLPDGRRVFVVTNFSVWDPVNGGTNFLNDTNTIALYHFDDTNNPFADASGNGYNLTKSGNVTLTNNANWMRSPTGYVARFQNPGDQLALQSTQQIPDSVILPGNGPSPQHPLTIEARIYPRAYKGDGQQILGLFQDFDTQWNVYLYAAADLAPTGVANTNKFFSPTQWNQFVALNTWNQVRITFDTNGLTSLYLNGTLRGTSTTAPHYERLNSWILTLGNFDGDIDEVRISNIVR